MKVKIEGDMYLESDSMQFIIKEYTGKVSKNEETGKETELYNTHGYFPSIESACRYLVKMRLKQSTASNLKELIQEMHQIEEWIHEQLKETA